MEQNKAKILLVEDEISLWHMLVRKLELENFEVITAVNGKEGLEKALSETPDLILLDILMPVMDGLTMLQKLRETNDYGKKVSVILLTNLSAGSEEIIKKIAQTEPAHYFVKVDMAMNDLIQKIRELVDAK